MIILAENVFEIIRPFMLLISPFWLISCLLKILYPDFRYGFCKSFSSVKKRRRRNAYWRLMKYKREFRRKVKYNVLFRKENSYLLKFMQKH